MTAATSHGSTGTPARAARRFHWPRIFGYDFFISFKLGPPPIGAQSYSSDLARCLRERDFTVFFSEEEAPPGQKLDGTLVRALRRSSVLVVVVTEGALVHSTWVRKEVEEFRRVHPKRPVIPIVVDRAIEKFRSVADSSSWLDHDGRIWLDETPVALQDGIATAAVLDRLAVSHRFIRANTWFRSAVAAIILVLVSLASWAAYEAWDATRRFQQATALRLAAEGSAMTSGARPGGSVRGLLQVLAAHRLVPSADADEALQAEFMKFQRQVAIRESSRPITSLAFSADGRWIAGGSYDGHIQLWDARTATPIGEAWRAGGRISSIAFGPEPGQIVTTTPDGVVQRSDISTRQLLPPDSSMPPPWFNWSTTVSRDGSRVAWGREMGDVVTWDLASNAPIAHLAAGRGSVGAPLALSFSPDGRRIAYYASSGHIGLLDLGGGLPGADALVWQADTGGGAQGFNPMMDYGVRSGVVAFSPDGSRIVSGSTGGSVQWWDAANGQPLSGRSEAHEGGVTALAFSPDGRFVLSGGNDNSLKLWSAETLKVLNAGEAGHTAPVTGVAISSDSQRAASAGLDGTLRVWDVPAARPSGRPVRSDLEDVTEVAFGTDGEPLVTGAGIQNMGKQRSPVFARSRQGSRQVVRVGDYELWLADATGKAITLLANNNMPVDNAVFSPDGARLASIGPDGLVLLWNADSGRALTPLQVDPRGVASIAFSLDGELIATGGHDATLQLWNVDTSKPLRPPIQAHAAAVYAVAFSPDRRRIVSASADGTIKIWQVATGRLLIGPMLGHEAGVSSVAFSPNGSRIVSGGGSPVEVQNEQRRLDYTLRLWDAATGRSIGRPLSGHTNDVKSVAFNADGRRVASSSVDRTTRVWDVLGTWADALCAKLPRNPTAAEWREWVSPNIDYAFPCPNLGTEPAPDGARTRGSARR